MTGARAPCPVCGQCRTYTAAKSARFAERHNSKCRRCANRGRNKKTLTLGFWEQEFNVIKRAAINRKKKYWNLSIADIHDVWERQDGKCAMTGLPMRKVPRTWSIDRIDNYCGYTPGNIQLVLKQVNMMRGSLTVDEFTEYCRNIANRSKK